MNSLIKMMSFAICFQLIFGVYPIGNYAYADGSNNQPKKEASLTYQNFTKNQFESEYTLFDQGALEGLETKTKELIMAGANDPVIKQEINSITAVLGEGEILTAPQRYLDSFLLARQKVHLINEGRTVNLSDLQERAGLPNINASFKGDVKFKNDPMNQRFLIQYSSKGEIAAEQILESREVIDFHVDKSHVYTLEKNGTIYAAPMKIIEQSAFNSPVPWIKIAKLNPEVMEYVKGRMGQLEIFGATAGMKPFDSRFEAGVFPLNQDGKFLGRWDAGDIVVRLNHANGTNEALGIYGFEAVRRNTGVGLQILAKQVDTLLENADLRKGLVPGGATENFTRKSKKEIKIEDSLLKMERNVFDSILVEAYNSEFLAENSPQRHVILSSELERDFSVLADNAKEKGVTEDKLEQELRDNWMDYVLGKEVERKRFWQKYGLGLAVLGTLSGVTGGAYAFHLLKTGALTEAPLWAINSLSYIYEHVGHHLLDVDYMWSNAGSMLFLAALVPIIYFTAKWQGSKIRKNAPATILYYSLKLWAVVLYPFFRALSKMAGQPVFLEALKAGANPFQKVSAKSPIGKKLKLQADTRLGISRYHSPLSKTADTDEKIRVKKEIISEMAAIDSRKQALAFVLGAGVTAKKYGIDLDVMYKAIKARRNLELSFAKVGKDYLNKEKILRKAHDIVKSPEQKAILDSIDYIKEVDLATKDVYIGLLDIKEAGLKDLKDLTKEEVGTFHKLAEDAVKFYGKDTLTRKIRRKARHINVLGSESIKRDFIGNSGVNSAFEFFWNVEPSSQIVEEYWEGFKSDYIFSAVQMGLVAARSWMHNPIALAADPAGIGFTYVPHLAATGEQIFIHMLPAAADKTYTFAEKTSAKYTSSVLEDVRYQPAEYVSLRGKKKQESFWRSSYNVGKRAGNLVQENYPMVFAKSQYNSFRTIRAGMTIGLPTLYAAGLDLSSAIASYLYISVGKIWAFTAYWYIEGAATINHKRYLVKENKALESAKARIGQGLRTSDTAMVLEGFNDLNAMYKKHSYKVKTKHAKAMNDKMKNIAKELKLSNSEFKDYKKEAAKHFSLIGRVANAIENGNLEELESAERSLRRFADFPEEFKDGKIHSIEDGKALLRYAMYNPPVASSMNRATHMTLLYFGAFLTTYLATGFFAEALDKEKDKWELLLKGVAITGVFYSVIFAAQFGLTALSKMYAKVSKKKGKSYDVFELARMAKSKITKKPYSPVSCRYSFSRANRGAK